MYWIAITGILLAVAYGGGNDLALWLQGLPTISAYLRATPAAFWVPVAVTAVVLAGLAFHLYLSPWR